MEYYRHIDYRDITFHDMPFSHINISPRALTTNLIMFDMLIFLGKAIISV